MEHKRELRLWGMGGRISGQLDGLVMDGPRGLVYDFKSGPEGATPADTNLQLRVQATLARENFPQLEEITVAIIAPRAWPRLTLCDYGAKDLDAARTELELALDRMERPEAPRVPAPGPCNWCRAKPVCPEFAATQTALVQADPAALSVENLPRLLALAGLAEKAVAARAEAIRAAALEILTENPDALDGWELKDGVSRRSIPESRKAYGRLADAGLPFDLLLDAATFSVGNLEKAVAKHKETSLRDAKGAVAETLGDLIEAKQCAPRIVKRK